MYRVTDMNTGAVYADKMTSFNILKRRINAKEKIEREINIHKQVVQRYLKLIFNSLFS